MLHKDSSLKISFALNDFAYRRPMKYFIANTLFLNDQTVPLLDAQWSTKKEATTVPCFRLYDMKYLWSCADQGSLDIIRTCYSSQAKKMMECTSRQNSEAGMISKCAQIQVSTLEKLKILACPKLKMQTILN